MHAWVHGRAAPQQTILWHGPGAGDWREFLREWQAVLELMNRRAGEPEGTQRARDAAWFLTNYTYRPLVPD